MTPVMSAPLMKVVPEAAYIPTSCALMEAFETRTVGPSTSKAQSVWLIFGAMKLTSPPPAT